MPSTASRSPRPRVALAGSCSALVYVHVMRSIQSFIAVQTLSLSFKISVAGTEGSTEILFHSILTWVFPHTNRTSDSANQHLTFHSQWCAFHNVNYLLAKHFACPLHYLKIIPGH